MFFKTILLFKAKILGLNLTRKKSKTSIIFKKKLIIDIGANDGISIKIIRKFVKNKIASFEPNIQNYKKIQKLNK